MLMSVGRRGLFKSIGYKGWGFSEMICVRA
jgi:hypothetical protein